MTAHSSANAYPFSPCSSSRDTPSLPPFLFADFFNGLTESPVALFGKKFGGMHGMNNTSPAAEGPQQDPPVNHELHVTLEELYLGAVKKMKITRKVSYI